MGGVSMEWKEVRLGEVADVQTGPFGSQLHKENYVNKGTPIVTVEHLGNKWFTSQNLPMVSDEDKLRLAKYCSQEGDVIFSRVGSVDRCSYVSKEYSGWLFSGRCLRVRPRSGINPEYLYYFLTNEGTKQYIRNIAVGATMPSINTKLLNEVPITIPSLDDQRRIASILSSLDRKIELNNKINADLEEMAQAIFKNWFVDFEPFKDGKFVDSELGMIPEGWKVGRLTEIASYMNGLAMQKFPPENNEDSLPVLKIKELGQGFCGTDSDRCSCNIKDECKIHNGDVIFSWSGTLLVDVWCGGDCGLNQHLFKVTSKDYPKWFYYYWTKHHLQEFIHIAKDKAVTMGHIKRGHLEEAMVAIPDNDSMEKAHELFEPILSKMISLRLESSRLSLLRDTLLPRLMSGELEVPE